MYSEMLRVSDIVHRRPTERALHELWKGQCNDAYWHGVFGGLYLPLLRRAAYSHLARAQLLTEYSLRKGNDWKSVSIESFYGMPEARIDTKQLGVCICPWLGGSVGVLSFKPAGVNLFDNLARIREPYHKDLLKMVRTRKKVKSIFGQVHAKEIDIKRFVYDFYPKTSFNDYLLDSRTDIDDMATLNFTELVKLGGHPYQLKRIRKGNSTAEALLERRVSNLRNSCTVKKEIRVFSGRPFIEVNYRVKAVSVPARFATEINFACLKDDRFEKKYGHIAEDSKRRSIEVAYSNLKVKLEFSREVDIWRIPVNTVSQSESGFESNMQCLSLIPNYELEGSGEFTVRMSLIED